jgi:hypothetical protein
MQGSNTTNSYAKVDTIQKCDGRLLLIKWQSNLPISLPAPDMQLRPPPTPPACTFDLMQLRHRRRRRGRRLQGRRRWLVHIPR